MGCNQNEYFKDKKIKKFIKKCIIAIMVFSLMVIIVPIIECDTGSTTYYVPDDYPTIHRLLIILNEVTTFTYDLVEYTKNISK